jgi:hypothetical protein
VTRRTLNDIAWESSKGMGLVGYVLAWMFIAALMIGRWRRLART